MLKLIKKGDPSWFDRARTLLVNGVRVPRISASPLPGHYNMQLVKGIPLCTYTDPQYVPILLKQVEAFSRMWVGSMTWTEYLNCIEHRCFNNRVMQWLRSIEVPSHQFCHGDLTLENVLVDGAGQLFLIDPNMRLNFNSSHLDRGKILFSRSYHDIFESYWLAQPMREAIDAETWSIEDYACLLTHIIRLSGHRDQAMIDRWLSMEFEVCESLS